MKQNDQWLACKNFKAYRKRPKMGKHRTHTKYFLFFFKTNQMYFVPFDNFGLYNRSVSVLSELSQWQPLLYCRLMTDFPLCYTIHTVHSRSHTQLVYFKAGSTATAAAAVAAAAIVAASTLFSPLLPRLHSTLFVTFILIVFAIFENI